MKHKKIQKQQHCNACNLNFSDETKSFFLHLLAEMHLRTASNYRTKVILKTLQSKNRRVNKRVNKRVNNFASRLKFKPTQHIVTLDHST